MFDIDLDKIQNKIHDYVVYHGRYPEVMFASENTLNLLEFKFNTETGIVIKGESLSYLFGIPVEVNNVIPFCEVEI